MPALFGVMLLLERRLVLLLLAAQVACAVKLQLLLQRLTRLNKLSVFLNPSFVDI
jgi:hypothetical protein